jgi:hypothetical protein
MVGIVVKYESTPVSMRVKGGHPQVGQYLLMVGQLRNQVGQLAHNCKALVCKSKLALSVGSRALSTSSRTSQRMHSQKRGVEQATCVWI